MTSKAKQSQEPVHKSIYVVAGKDHFLVESQCRQLVNRLLDPQQMMSLYNVDADKANLADVLDELRTLPFLADKRVVLLKDADDFISDNRELLEKYFDNPSPTGVLVLTVSGWPANTRLAKKLTSVGELVTVEEIKSWKLPQYAVTYAQQKHSKALQTQAAAILVDLVGDDPGLLCSEIDKLAVYADDQKTITVGHIEALTGQNRMFNAFAVIDAMIAGDAAKAIERLRNMFSADRSAEYTVVGAFAYHFRKMFNAKAMMDKGVNTSQIANQLRIWGDKENFFRRLSQFKLERIGRFLQELANIDHSMKTGQRTAQTAMEQLIIKITSDVSAF